MTVSQKARDILTPATINNSAKRSAGEWGDPIVNCRCAIHYWHAVSACNNGRWVDRL